MPTLLVYTDGSYGSLSKSGGWAWAAVDENPARQWVDSGFEPPPTTNNRMELMAVKMALIGLYEEFGPCELEIVSDSRYVVLGCTDPDRARNVNQDIWEDIDEARLLHDHLQWRHVRGHQGTQLNELVDRLANIARKGGVLDRYDELRTNS